MSWPFFCAHFIASTPLRLSATRMLTFEKTKASIRANMQRLHGAVFNLLDGATLGGDAVPRIRGILLFVQVLPHAGVTSVAVYPFVFIPDKCGQVISAGMSMPSAASARWVSAFTSAALSWASSLLAWPYDNALSLVTSRAMVPSFNSFISGANNNTWTNSYSSLGRKAPGR